MEEGGGHRGLRGTPDVWRWALTFRPAQTPGMLPSPSRQGRGLLPAQPLPPGARPGLRPTSGGRGTETRGAEALHQRSRSAPRPAPETRSPRGAPPAPRLRRGAPAGPRCSPRRGGCVSGQGHLWEQVKGWGVVSRREADTEAPRGRAGRPGTGRPAPARPTRRSQPFTQTCPSRDTEAVQSAHQDSPGWGWAPLPRRAAARPPSQDSHRP